MNRITALLAPLALVGLGFGAARLFADDGSKPAAPAVPPAPAAPFADAKTEKVRRLLRDQGAAALAQKTLDKMMDQFRNMGTLPAGFVEKFKERADAAALMELTVPSYVKHLDEETLDAVIAFYATPAGRKLAAALPDISMESMDAGIAWGQKTAMEVMKELQDETSKPK